jgi:3-hydroxyisobutyrate dehydrogenase
MTEAHIGWIGLGRMGASIAERLALAGHSVSGYNRTRSKAEDLVGSGLKVADRPSGLASCDVVFVMVSTFADVEAVAFGPDGLFSVPGKAPKVLIDSSTISAADSANLRERIRKFGTEMLVMPVSGNDRVVRAGKLGVIASGPRAVYDELLPIFRNIGQSVTYVGERESGRVVKICHNLLLGIVMQSLAEISVLAEKNGVSREVLFDHINNSIMGSTMTRYKTPVFVNLDFSVVFALELMLKDLDLGLGAGKASGTQLPVTERVRSLVADWVDAGHASEDFSTVLLQQAAASGLDIKSENAVVSDGLR